MNYEEIAAQFGFTTNRVSTIHEALGENATVEDVRAVAQIVLEQGSTISQAVALFRGEPATPKTRRKADSKRTTGTAKPKNPEGKAGSTASNTLMAGVARRAEDEGGELRVQYALHRNRVLAGLLLVPDDQITDDRIAESEANLLSLLLGAAAVRPFEDMVGVPTLEALYGTSATLQIEAAVE